ncbi:hypothetical protein BpHYR1_009253, partial [Brachionus plicatilis]
RHPEERRTTNNCNQKTNESTPSREWSFKPTILTPKQDIRTWWNRFRRRLSESVPKGPKVPKGPTDM